MDKTAAVHVLSVVPLILLHAAAGVQSVERELIHSETSRLSNTRSVGTLRKVTERANELRLFCL